MSLTQTNFALYGSVQAQSIYNYKMDITSFYFMISEACTTLGLASEIINYIMCAYFGEWYLMTTNFTSACEVLQLCFREMAGSFSCYKSISPESQI